jgi:hypothetical protein
VLGDSGLCKRKRVDYVATNALIVRWAVGKHFHNLDTRRVGKPLGKSGQFLSAFLNRSFKNSFCVERIALLSLFRSRQPLSFKDFLPVI